VEAAAALGAAVGAVEALGAAVWAAAALGAAVGTAEALGATVWADEAVGAAVGPAEALAAAVGADEAVGATVATSTAAAAVDLAVGESGKAITSLEELEGPKTKFSHLQGPALRKKNWKATVLGFMSVLHLKPWNHVETQLTTRCSHWNQYFHMFAMLI